MDLCADKFLQEVSDKRGDYIISGDKWTKKYVKVLREDDSGKTFRSYTHRHCGQSDRTDLKNWVRFIAVSPEEGRRKKITCPSLKRSPSFDIQMGSCISLSSR